MAPSPISTPLLVAALAGLLAYLYGPATQKVATRMGVMRQLSSTVLANSEDLVIIQDTTHCEDLHYYAPAKTIFAACEDDKTTRFEWFPPLAVFNNASVAWAAQGSLHTIDVETKKSKRLTFENFGLPFITHGIDVIADLEMPEAVYLFAVNHLPNGDVYPKEAGKKVNAVPETKDAPKARSQIEIFHHVIGSASARHVRSVVDAAIKTPNDIFAVSPTAFYVTNDHHYREGALRSVEDVWPGATWSNVVKVSVGEGDGPVTATPALEKFHNPNGLAHGRTAEEILVASATGGELFLGKITDGAGDIRISVQESFDLDSTIDNPSYFSDPYPDVEGDASGFIMAGLAKATELGSGTLSNKTNAGVMVWYVKPAQKEGVDAAGQWDKRLLYQDDGSNIKTASAAVIVPIDPAMEDGKKKGWLFISGFTSDNAIAVKVEL